MADNLSMLIKELACIHDIDLGENEEEQENLRKDFKELIDKWEKKLDEEGEEIRSMQWEDAVTNGEEWAMGNEPEEF